MYVFLILIFLIGCQNPAPTPLPQTLRVSFSQDPATLDPRKSSDYSSSTLVSLLFEGLMRCKSGSELEMAAAEKVTYSEDGKTYLFTLRKTFWSDGSSVTAKDFENSWKTLLTPGFPSPCAYLLYPIKNAESYAKGLCSIDEVGIHSIDESTLKIELEEKTPYFLSLTAFPLYMPTPSHVNENQEKAPFICNGPFQLERRQPGEEIVLKKNERYWNPKAVRLEKIHIYLIANECTALHLFERGELDLVGGPFNPFSIDLAPKTNENPPLHFLPMAASTFCIMNIETFPFSNKTMRKAFASAIQRHPMILERIRLMQQIEATHLLPPSLRKGFASECSSLPIEEASILFRKALAELQITPQDLNELTLYYKANPVEKKIGEILQNIWKEAFGIQVRLEQMDPKSLLQRLYAKNFQISLASWIAQFHDPINILDRFKDGKNQKNYSGWFDFEYQNLLHRSKQVDDESQRLKLLGMAEKMLEEQTLCIPLYHWSSPILIHPRVSDLTTTDSGGILIEWSKITEPESSSQHH